MSFSPEWEQRYVENTHMSIWPWSDLVSLVRRHRPSLGSTDRVLEVGCGAGANIPFFASCDVQYHAIEGSLSVVRRLREKFPRFANNILVGDFTESIPFSSGSFDLIVDRAAITHNSTAAIESALSLIWAALVPGGYFIGVDWFSTNYSEYRRGEAGPDIHTRINYTDGAFTGTGRVHFSDPTHIYSLFSAFDVSILTEKTLRQVEPREESIFASFNIVAKKPIY